MTRAAKSRADGRERQAVAAAEAAGAGRAHAAFTPTEAAARPAGLGQGRPLPGALRTRAETAFNADLGAVRLHPGAANEGVPAYTAGPDILFAPGPAPGETLVLHEIAHVLQQSAERIADGRLRVVQRHGLGRPYAAGGPLEGENKPEREDLVDTLIDLHRSGDGGATDDDLEAVITRLRAPGFDPEGIGGKTFSDEILAGRFTGTPKRLHELSRRARGLIFDVLKFGGWNQAAAKLLTGDIDLPSAARHNPLLLYFNATPGMTEELLPRIFGPGRRLRQFFTNAMPEAIRNYLLDLPRQRQALYGWTEYYDTLWAELYDWRVLGRNDAIAYGAAIVSYFAEEYDQFLIDAEAASGDRIATPLLFKANMATAISEWAPELASFYAGSPTMGFVADALFEVEDIALRAHALWLGAWRRAQSLHLLAAGVEDATRPLGETAPVRLVRTELRRAAFQLFSVAVVGGKKVMPSASVNRANRCAFSDKIAELAGALDTRLRQIGLREAESTEEEEDVASLRLLMGELESALHAHDALTPEATEPDQLEDIRFANRLHMARMLGQMARILRDEALERRVTEVLNGQDIEGTTLALLSSWKADRTAPVNDLAEDFKDTRFPLTILSSDENGDPVDLPIPFTIPTLVNTYKLLYSRRLAGFLENVLNNPTPEIDNAEETVLTQAYRAARGTIDRPTRWIVPRYEIAIYPGETRSWREILGGHPRTGREVYSQIREDGAVILPLEAGAVFAWVIPSLAPMITQLRKTEAVDAIVGETVVDTSTLTNLEWLDNLTIACEDSAVMARVLTAFTDKLTTLQAAEDTRLKVLVPAAVSYQRRLLVPDIEALLQDYIDDHLGNYGAPNRAALLIEDFLRFVTPEELEGTDGNPVPHAAAQNAALLLGLSGKLLTAFAPENVSGIDALGRRVESRFDVITAFTPLLRVAIDASATSRIAGVRQVTEAAEFTALDVTTSRRELRLLLRQFEDVAAQMSEKLSFMSTGRALKSNLYASEIVPSREPFMHDGREVAIEALLTDQPFVFLPAYGRGNEQILPPMLLDGQRAPMDSTGRPLVRIRFAGGESFDITDELDGLNLRMLEELNDIVTDRALQLSLENTLEVIETAGELALDAAEFVPGAGQALMVARIVHAIYQFFTTDEFDDMLAVLRGDPVRMFEELLAKLTTDLFESDKIWQFLLFDTSGISYLDAEPPRDQRRERVRRRDRTGRFARLMEGIAKIPKSLYNAIDEVRERTVPAAQNIQFYTATHPRVAQAMEAAAAIIGGSTLFDDLSDLSDALSGGQDAEEALGAKLNAMLAAVDHFNLPDDPIPNELIVERMLEFTLERLKRAGKLGTAIKIGLPVLRATGALAEISERLAAALAGTAIDPNVYWRDNIRDEFIDAFTDAKAEFVTKAEEALGQFGLTGLNAPGRVNTTGRAFEGIGDDASPSLNPALRPDRRIAPPVISAGERLPRPLAARSAREFGHDMRHVRLHRGADAARLTARYGADGLAAGSHVFLRPGLSPTSAPGARVFRHELAHVLQDSGPRPLGAARHSDAPRPLRRGGLSLHSGREAGADRAARVAGESGHRIGRPVDAGASGGPAATGLAPAFGGRAMARVLRLFTEPVDVEEYLSDIESAAARHRRATPGLNDARRIWTATKTAVGGTGSVSWAGPLRQNDPDLRTAISNQLSTGAGAAIDDNRISALAERAQKNRPGAPDAAGYTTELDPAAFANVLETYVFALTGVALSIRVNNHTPPDVTRVRVFNLDLGRINSLSHPLWVKALAGSPRTSSLDAQNKEILFRIVGLRRPDEQLFESREYRLHEKFLDRLDELKRATAAVSALVNWADYTTVDPSGPGTHSDHRLYLGPHGRLQGLVTDRESHHIPQFVLVEYFRNEAETKMFNTPEERFPGFEPTTNPGKYDDGTEKIDFDKLRPTGARGDGMPAILLAARTHKMGKLHIGGKDGWTNHNDYGAAPKTQSDQVDTRFKRSAVRRLIAAGAPATATHNSIRPAVDWASAPANRDTARSHIFEAMRETYHWMYRDVMRPSLKRALRTEEPKFYVTAALQSRGGTATTLPDAFNPSKAMGRADSVMSQVDAMQHSAAYEIRNFHPNL